MINFRQWRACFVITVGMLATWAAAAASGAYIKASNTGAGDEFASAVAVSGDTLVVGSPLEDSSASGVNGKQGSNTKKDSGASYVYVRIGTNWVQQAYLKASNPDADDYFGGSVAISGDTVVIGAQYEASSATGVNGNQSDNNAPDSGAVYVFVRNGTNWVQQAYLKASNTGSSDVFGDVVAVSGDTVVVGARGEASTATGVNGNQSDNNAPDSGAVYVFVRNGTNWIQQAYLKASNTDSSDVFGDVVAVSGDTVVVGAQGEASTATGVNGDQSNNSATGSGAAYVFVRNGSTWSQQAYLKASNSQSFDYFGSAVAASGHTVVVGAYGEDSNATRANGNQSNNSATGSGAAYVFVRSGSAWSQQAYLKASNPDALDAFGDPVAVSGDTVVVGAYGESSNAAGANGNQDDNSADYAGAAYIFTRHETTWSQHAYLKATNPEAYDYFSKVAISSVTVVAGAAGEDCNTSGVNGSQSNNNALESGSAYIFTDLGFGPSLVLSPDGSEGCFIRFAGHAGLSYQLQRAASFSGPWSTISSQTTPPSGLFEFRDQFPPRGQAFYRTVQP